MRTKVGKTILCFPPHSTIIKAIYILKAIYMANKFEDMALKRKTYFFTWGLGIHCSENFPEYHHFVSPPNCYSFSFEEQLHSKLLIIQNKTINMLYLLKNDKNLKNVITSNLFAFIKKIIRK